MYKNTVSLFITEKCDQRCEYCDIPLIQTPKDLDLDLFKKYISIINKKQLDEVCISGGEIGTLNIEILDQLFKLIDKKVIIYTNGLFFKKNYYDRYKEQICGVRYHVLDNKEIEKDVPKNTYFVYVITKKNIDNIQNIVGKYKDINLNFVLYDDKRNDESFVLNDIDVQKLKIIENYIEKSMHQVIEKCYKIRNKIETTLKCFTSVPQIDFVRGKVLQCCKCHTMAPSQDISETSIDDVLQIKESKRWYMCNNCFDYFSDNSYKTTLHLNLKRGKK